jgi:hypothetical protein
VRVNSKGKNYYVLKLLYPLATTSTRFTISFQYIPPTSPQAMYYFYTITLAFYLSQDHLKVQMSLCADGVFDGGECDDGSCDAFQSCLVLKIIQNSAVARILFCKETTV